MLLPIHFFSNFKCERTYLRRRERESILFTTGATFNIQNHVAWNFFSDSKIRELFSKIKSFSLGETMLPAKASPHPCQPLLISPQYFGDLLASSVQ